jgi:hypothetical protein
MYSLSNSARDLPVINARSICAVKRAGVGLVDLSSSQIGFHKTVVLQTSIGRASCKIVKCARLRRCHCRVLVSRTKCDRVSPCYEVSVYTRGQQFQDDVHTEFGFRTLVV